MRKTLLISSLLVVSSLLNPTMADGNDLMQEIIDQCRAQMSQYGASLVKVCVDQDIAAIKALSEYPEETHPIIAQCRAQMGEYGWALVKTCADQDIAAEEALSNY